MSAKKTILILCDWFLPGYLAGGPIQSIATLTEHLSSDFNFKIITSDRDFNASKPYEGINVNQWTDFSGREVFYLSPDQMKPRIVLNLIRQTPHDVLYLNSLFSTLFSVYPLLWKRQSKIQSKLVLAPRGMLRDGALAVKPIKKTVFIFLSKLLGLFKNVNWQSTSQQESLEIRARIGKNVLISEISNFPSLRRSESTIKKEPGFLKICFIARIVDIKNLIFVLDILENVKIGNVELDVYGPKEDGEYWVICEDKANHLPSNVKFKYKCVLTPEEIGNSIVKYHVLFLPTRTENFGHIIVETLQHGRPVLISDQTPWRDLKKHNAGYDISLDKKEDFLNAVAELIQMNQQEFDQNCRDSITYIRDQLDINKIKAGYLSLFSK